MADVKSKTYRTYMQFCVKKCAFVQFQLLSAALAFHHCTCTVQMYGCQQNLYNRTIAHIAFEAMHKLHYSKALKFWIKQEARRNDNHIYPKLCEVFHKCLQFSRWYLHISLQKPTKLWEKKLKWILSIFASELRNVSYKISIRTTKISSRYTLSECRFQLLL